MLTGGGLVQEERRDNLQTRTGQGGGMTAQRRRITQEEIEKLDLKKMLLRTVMKVTRDERITSGLKTPGRAPAVARMSAHQKEVLSELEGTELTVQLFLGRRIPHLQLKLTGWYHLQGGGILKEMREGDHIALQDVMLSLVVRSQGEDSKSRFQRRQVPRRFAEDTTVMGAQVLHPGQGVEWVKRFSLGRTEEGMILRVHQEQEEGRQGGAQVALRLLQRGR